MERGSFGVLPYIARDHIPAVMPVLERYGNCDHRRHHLWRRTTLIGGLEERDASERLRFPSLLEKLIVNASNINHEPSH